MHKLDETKPKLSVHFTVIVLHHPARKLMGPILHLPRRILKV